MRILTTSLAFISAVAVSIGAPLRAPFTVPMSQYDYPAYRRQPSGVDPQPVQRDATHFGKLFSRRVDDSIYALPLIVSDLEIH